MKLATSVSARARASSITTIGSILVGAFIAVASPAPAQAQDAVRPNDEAALIQRYCAAGPARAQAQSALARGRAAVTSASVLPNPSVSLEHNRSLTGPEDSETIVGLGFPLGIGGRRFLLEEAAEERLTERSAHADAILLEGALSLREALVRAVAEQRRLELLKTHVASLEALGATIRSLQKGGESSQRDLLRHELELGLQRSKLSLQSSAAVSARALLRAYLAADDTELSGLELDALAASASPEKPATHPELRSLAAATRASEVEADAANRRWVPDLDLFFGYRQVTALQTDVGHGFTLRIAMPLTFLDFGQGDAAIADSDAASVRAEQAALESRMQAEREAADAALAELEPASPQANDAQVGIAKLLEQTQQLYLADEASMAELLDVTSLSQDSAQASVDQAERRALIRISRMRAIGSLFDPELDRACKGAQ